jgi:hypothetical protein
MKCLTDHELELIAAGAGGEGADWRRHVDACEECRGRLEEVEKDLELQEEIQEIKQDGFLET